MNIQTFPTGPIDTNSYLAICPHTRQAIIIDPAPGSLEAMTPYITENKILPQMMLLTHSHWDHIADVDLFKKRYGIPVFIHEADAGNLENPGSDQLICWIFVKGVKPDGYFKEGDILKLGEWSFHVIETPGHTPGGVCFYCPEAKALFSGDTLFKGSIGSLSFATARPDLMWDSLDKLSKLPPETKIYPGHGLSTTIREETWLPRAKEIFGS
jgi:hydroxyacylglutathione hydrolase